jgi:hypothetical protein
MKKNLWFGIVGLLCGVIIGTMIKNPQKADQIAVTALRALI